MARYDQCYVDCTTDCGSCKGGWNLAKAAVENEGDYEPEELHPADYEQESLDAADREARW